jgi:hypothetical protein
MDEKQTEQNKLQPISSEVQSNPIGRKIGRIAKSLQSFDPGWSEWCRQPRPEIPTWLNR